MRSWRAGSLTLGIILVVFGITLIISKMFGAFTIFEVALWWPVLLILLGCEVLAALRFSDEKPLKVKYDGGSIFLMSLILIFTMGISSVTFAVHLVPGGANTIRNAIFHENAVVNTTHTLNSKSVKLNNKIGGNISISSHNGNETVVDTVVTVQNMTNEMLKQKKDEILTVDKEGGLISTLPPEYSYLHNVRVDFDIKVPKGINIDIKNQHGNINILAADCDVTVDNKRGDFTASRCSGKINVKNSRGSINLNSISGSTIITNKDGNIIISDIKAKTVINSTDGNVEILSGNELKEDISVNSTNGNLKLFLVENQGGSLNTAVYSGNIKTNVKGNILENGGAKKLDYTLPGAGPKFDITANAGDFELILGKN